MNTFLITFEILYPSLSVQEDIITTQIKSLGSWARPTSKTWLVKTNYTRDYVMDRLQAVSGPNDRILVMRVDNDWIALHLPNDVITWMKAGL